MVNRYFLLWTGNLNRYYYCVSAGGVNNGVVNYSDFIFFIFTFLKDDDDYNLKGAETSECNAF